MGESLTVKNLVIWTHVSGAAKCYSDSISDHLPTQMKILNIITGL